MCDILNKFKKMGKLDKALVILSITLVLVVTFSVIYYFYDTGKRKETNPDKEPPQSVYDPNLIPTYPEVNEVMDSLVEDVYGKSYYELMNSVTTNEIKLPNTNVSISVDSFGDARDLAIITSLVYYRNPYLNKSDSMNEDSPLLSVMSEPVKELPTGHVIDLSTIVEEYSEVKLSYNRNNPLHISVTGKSNDNYFSEDIDLTPFYQYYFYE